MSNIKPKSESEEIDNQIFECINPNNPKSFFLFAGAGSGKTRTLVNVLSKFKEKYGKEFKLKNKKVAIITYTNAAANEIKHRLEYDPIFEINTIHSFSWELIHSLTKDIKDWLKIDYDLSITKLMEEQSRSRDLNNKTSIDRARKIESIEKRLRSLDEINKFIYNPNTENISIDSLNHSQVIKITSDFIQEKDLMKDIIVSKFPIIFVDESQDTKKELMEALFMLQTAKKDNFSLGLFGDTMQRIYTDGKEDLGINLPDGWLQPAKQINYRSKKRIINLINDIRKDVDKQIQISSTENEEGSVRLFICSRDGNKKQIEEKAANRMYEITKDSKWNHSSLEIKRLILEHHMAANRMNFLEIFEPLHKVDKLKIGLINGTLSGLTLFTKVILPLIQARRKDDDFGIARIVKQNSPLFNKDKIKESKDQLENINAVNQGINELLSLWEKDDPKLIDILNVVKKNALFNINPIFNIILSRTEAEKKTIEDNEETNEIDIDRDEEIDAWDIALQVNFSQIENYSSYFSEKSEFTTHQGVKGLEYPRVMVIIDDKEARGNWFSYDKLFGIKELNDNDVRNIKDGKETGVERTKRLFYVACSRAKDSLAIIAYTDKPEILKENVIKYNWFREEEIEVLN